MRERRRDRGCSEKAGCVPVRRGVGGAWEVLLVQSRWTEGSWSFPKGGVEEGETGVSAAVRETVEEGGVMGVVAAKLGLWTLHRGVRARLRMWLLVVDKELPADDSRWAERSHRVRAWFSFPAAHDRLAHDHHGPRPELLQVLDAATAALDNPALDLGLVPAHLLPRPTVTLPSPLPPLPPSPLPPLPPSPLPSPLHNSNPYAP